jgi:hypothetical protein
MNLDLRIEPLSRPQRAVAAALCAVAAVLFWLDAERTQEHAQMYVTMMEGAVARLLQWDAVLSRRTALAFALGAAWLSLGLRGGRNPADGVARDRATTDAT